MSSAGSSQGQGQSLSQGLLAAAEAVVAVEIVSTNYAGTAADGSMVAAAKANRALLDSAGRFEFEPRRARAQRRRVAVAEIDEEVRLPPTIRKECRVHLGAVEAPHRTAG